MVKLYNIFNRFYDFSRNQNLYIDKDLIKYFKTEFGNEWKIELEKHLSIQTMKRRGIKWQ